MKALQEALASTIPASIWQEDCGRDVSVERPSSACFAKQVVANPLWWQIYARLLLEEDFEGHPSARVAVQYVVLFSPACDLVSSVA